MNGKKLIYLASGLVVVVLIIIVSEMLSSKQPSAKSLKFFPELTEKQIGSILIIQQADSVKLHRKGDIWVVGSQTASSSEAAAVSPMGKPDSTTTQTAHAAVREYPADSASVQTMLEKILAMQKDVLASDNPAKQSIFEVDSLKGIYVEMWDDQGKSLGAFRIGKNGPDWTSNFVRTVGSNAVYSVGGSIKYSFFADKKRWRDKNITRFDRTNVKTVSLAKKDGTLITLAKADTGTSWKLTAPIAGAANTAQVDEILNKLANFTASDIEDSAYADSSMGFKQPELTVSVAFAGGSTKQVMVGGPKGTLKKFWVKTEGKDFAYLVDDVDIQKLDKNVDGLKAPDAATAAAIPTGVMPTGLPVGAKVMSPSTAPLKIAPVKVSKKK